MNWREIERVRKDATRFRALAAALLATSSDLLRPWELEFLESVARQNEIRQFSTRQGEKLMEIRDGLKMTDTAYGFSVRLLIERCHIARLDLSEPDEEWIVAMHTLGGKAVRVNQIGRLMRCARQLNLVDQESE